jgi:hypothetical protein
MGSFRASFVRSARGRGSHWQHAGFRRSFSVITIVWGMTFLAEAAAQVVIVETASATIAKTTSNLMPIVVVAVVASWTGLYGRWQQA